MDQPVKQGRPITPQPERKPGAISAEEVIINYPSYSDVTAEAIPVTQEMQVLCGPPPTRQGSYGKEGPHALHEIVVYMNELANEWFSSGD